MSNFKVFLVNTVGLQLSDLFEQSSSCEWGGVLVGEFEKTEGSLRTKIFGAIPATYKQSFLDEFKTTSQMWKHFYTERDSHYPGAKIVGWYNYSPSLLWEPSEVQYDLHRKFFDTEGQVLLFVDRNGDQHCYTSNEQGSSFEPCSITGFDGYFKPESNKSKMPKIDKEKISLRQGFKMAGVFFMFFMLSVLGIMYKDITKPINTTAVAVNSGSKEIVEPPHKPTNTPSNDSSNNATIPDTADTVVTVDIPVNSGQPLSPNDSDTKVRSYTVQRGDSLWIISVKFYGSGFSFYKILSSNNIYNPNTLRIGQVLMIPEEQ